MSKDLLRAAIDVLAFLEPSPEDPLVHVILRPGGNCQEGQYRNAILDLRAAVNRYREVEDNE